MLNIRKLREERGLTQKDLVEMTGLAQGTIASYERKYKTMKKFIKIGNIEKITKALGISTKELIDEHKEVIRDMACLNQACLLNENKKCGSRPVRNGEAPCHGRDLIKDKVTYKSDWVGLAGRWGDYR